VCVWVCGGIRIKLYTLQYLLTAWHTEIIAGLTDEGEGQDENEVYVQVLKVSQVGLVLCVFGRRRWEWENEGEGEREKRTERRRKRRGEVERQYMYKYFLNTMSSSFCWSMNNITSLCTPQEVARHNSFTC